jgi:hypothetical protein
MTETEARTLLSRAAYDDLDNWIASQPWQAVPDG